MDSTRFDQIVRSLAQPASRRAFAALVAGALTAIGGVSPGDAKRTQRRRRPGAGPAAGACARFCRTLFAPGPDRARCLSDAAHGRGLCVACEAQPSAVCCARTDGRCASYATAECCRVGCTPTCAGQPCGGDDGCGGTCDGFCPVVGETCTQGVCVCASGVICVSECCSAKTDVCNPQTGECCAPKTCRDYPPGTCGSQDNGCGGTVDCGCCPGTPCACPPGRTLCDGFRGPVVYCPGTNCLCVGRADGQGSVCYRGGTCYNDDAICQTDADCAAAGAPGFNCVKAGDCALGCDRTACVAPCAGNASGPRRPRISVRPSPERQRPADAVGAPNVGFA